MYIMYLNTLFIVFRCHELDHWARDCPNSKSEVECYNCNMMGHIARDCPKGTNDVTCYRCNELGHYARDCLNDDYDE